MQESNKSKMSLITSMFIFGTIGIFRKYIPLPSSVLAMARGLVGMLFLLAIIRVKKTPIDREAIKRNLILLILSGAVLGFNWILLFEAYRYTTVATATLCYYMAPILVILVSPFLLKERLTKRKLACVAVALVGMYFVSGMMETGFSGAAEFKGIFLGLGAAVFYACVMLFNKFIKGIGAFDKTIMQLGASTVVLIPYILLTEDLAAIAFDGLAVAMIFVVGIVHTGIAYALYFGSMDGLRAQTIALFSYIDPVVAILLSALVLKEAISMWGVIGAVLVLGATLISELPERKKV